MIYSAQVYLELLGYPTWLGDYPLWLAATLDSKDEYKLDGFADIPDSLRPPQINKDWIWLWQYTWDGRSNGYAVNDYNLCRAPMLQYLGNPITVVITPKGATMQTATVTANPTLNIRNGPGTTYSVAGTLKLNDVVTGQDNGAGWFLLSTINGVVWPAGLYCSTGYLDITGTVPSSPSTSSAPTSVSITMPDGSVYVATQFTKQ